MTRRIAAAISTVGLLLGVITLIEGHGAPVEAGGACRGEPVTTERATSVEMGEMPCFTPTIVEVDRGDTVTWTNTGSMVHNVAGANASWGAFDEIGVGGSASHRFDRAGVYPYSCMLHPGMIGAVVVGEGSASGAPASLVGSSGDTVLSAVTAERDDSSIPVELIASATAIAVVIAGVGGYAFGRQRL